MAIVVSYIGDRCEDVIHGCEHGGLLTQMLAAGRFLREKGYIPVLNCRTAEALRPPSRWLCSLMSKRDIGQGDQRKSQGSSEHTRRRSHTAVLLGWW